MYVSLELTSFEESKLKRLDDLLSSYSANKERRHTDSDVEKTKKYFKHAFNERGVDLGDAERFRCKFLIRLDDTRNFDALIESLQSKEMNDVVNFNSVHLNTEAPNMPGSKILAPPYMSVK